jgi:hypothetical protein
MFGFGRPTGESRSSCAPAVEEKEGGRLRFWREWEVVVRGWGFVVTVAEAIRVRSAGNIKTAGLGLAN